MDDTLIQFKQASGAGNTVRLERRAAATVCPVCAQHFSPEGRFCPFDGEPLQPAPDWDPSTDPLLGSVVDSRYEVIRVLGEGGMGVVYETRHRALGKRFALKALRKDLASDGEIAARFMQEARTAASVSHPGLVEITDFGRLASGQPFFVMELLEGQSLASLIRRGGPIPAMRAVDIIRQIAEALGAAHERSIVHRDLKPDNIHVTPEANGRDRVTIVDFGLAKVIGASRLTRAGVVFGTPHYMSPEQAMGEVTDHRADVYALGVVMYEMFTGRVPFEADSYMGVLTKHMYMAPTPPSQLPGTERLGVLESVLMRCLQKKPEQRYQSLAELCLDLDRALVAAGGAPVAERSRPRPRSLLADELELPTRDELGLGLEAALPKPWPRWPMIIAGGLFLAGIGSMLGIRSAQHASVSSVSSAPVASVSSVAFGPAKQDPLPSVTSAAPVAPSPQPSQNAAASAAGGTAKPRPPAVRKPAEPAPAPVVPPKKPARVGGSEIVDPWAK